MCCAYCEEPILSGEPLERAPHVPGEGKVVWQTFHRECFVRMLVGGLNHQRRDCTCCGGALPPDPPGLSRREAARQAVAYYWNQRGGAPLFR
jgi:hypothetical protein